MSGVAVDALDFQAADPDSLPEVANFFVDSFWLGSTTFGDGVKLSGGERNQLVRKVSEDLGSRYGLLSQNRPSNLSGRETPSLFWSNLILAREGPDGPIVGCVGLEASMFDVRTGAVLRSEQADRLLRTEIDAMTDGESERAEEVFRESGIGALATHLLRRDESELVQKFAQSYAPYALLANLAVSPSCRGQGLGTELCDFWSATAMVEPRRARARARVRVPLDSPTDTRLRSELACQGMDDILLQVEDVNGAARKLYGSLGYEPIYRTEEATALRLNPSKSAMSAFLPIENESLLKEEPTQLVTMAKHLGER